MPNDNLIATTCKECGKSFFTDMDSPHDSCDVCAAEWLLFQHDFSNFVDMYETVVLPCA